MMPMPSKSFVLRRAGLAVVDFAALRGLRAASLALACGTVLCLSGCGGIATAPSAASSEGVALSGSVHGGQQPVSGAKVYLYAASTTAYSGAATSLLAAPGYVTTDAGGTFSFSPAGIKLYNCPTGSYVYALALGGNPGLASPTANNAELALMEGLGPCSSLTTSTILSINEASTISSVYALSAFMTSETQVGTSATNVQGLANAFSVIGNLTGVAGGVYATTPAGNGTAPQATLDTLANALSACVNSDGTGTPCSSLMTAASVSTTAGTPVDTVQAALNIAQHPGVNVGTIYSLAAAVAPFQPSLTAAPNDWTLQIQYAGGLNQVQGLAVDATGNVFASNSLGGNITEFSPTGTVLGTLTAPTLFRPQEMAIDLNGNLWTGSRANANATPSTSASLVEFSSNGTLLSGTTGFTGGGLTVPRGIAVDPRGNVWAAGNAELSEFTSAGAPVSSNTGYTSANLLSFNLELSFDTAGNAWVPTTDANANSGLIEFVPVSASFNASGIYGGSFRSFGTGTNYPISVAIDASNDVWIANAYGGSTTFAGGPGSLTEYSSAGAELSPTLGYTNAGIVQPQTVTIDGVGNVYSAQSTVGVLTKTGAAVSPASGYMSVNQNDCCLASAIDLSGNYWTSGAQFIYQWVGLAAPVVTPKVKGVVNGTLAARP